MRDRQRYALVTALLSADGADGSRLPADAIVSARFRRSDGVLTVLTVLTDGLSPADCTQKFSRDLFFYTHRRPHAQAREPVGVSTVSTVSTALTSTNVGQHASAPTVSAVPGRQRPPAARASAPVCAPAGQGRGESPSSRFGHRAANRAHTVSTPKTPLVIGEAP